jgi:hypothetical protein
MMLREKSATFEPENLDELSRFFEVNKDTYHEIWIFLTKKKHADPNLYHSTKTEPGGKP